MRFFHAERLRNALVHRYGTVRRNDTELGYTLEFDNGELHFRITAPEHAAIGSNAHRLLHLSVDDLSRGSQHSESEANAQSSYSPYLATTIAAGARRQYPVSAAETESELDVVRVLEAVLDPVNRSFNPYGTSAELVHDFVMDPAGKRPNRRGNQVIVASHGNEAPDTYFLDIHPPEVWLEQLGICEYRSDIRSTNVYEPYFDVLYEEARNYGKQESFHREFAADWNKKYAMKYWRLRACVIDRRLTFRMPFCTSRINLEKVGQLELQAIEAALSNRLEMPYVKFHLSAVDQWLDSAMRIAAIFNSFAS